MKQLLTAFIIIILTLNTGCRDTYYETVPTTKTGKLIINIEHTIDNEMLVWDSIMYHNRAGNVYSVTKLQYYLSNFHFYYKSQLVNKADSIYYIDAKENASFILQDLKQFQFDSLAFIIGIDSLHNISYSLPATDENTGMSWPDAMGGGYHFLKLEGHWNDGSETEGFAMHVGKNGYQVNARAKCHVKSINNADTYMTLVMNINEWFRNPHAYNFSTDGVYSMGNALRMKKLAENGRDVFSIKN